MDDGRGCQSQSTGRSFAVHEEDSDVGIISECSDWVGVLLAVIQVNPGDCVLIQCSLDDHKSITPSGENKVLGGRGT